MEKGVSLRRYTDLEKEELMDQWKQSGKSKVAFCKERSIGYYSFCSWVKRRTDKSKNGLPFVPVQIKPAYSESIFARVVLKNGTTINLHHPVESTYLIALLKS